MNPYYTTSSVDGETVTPDESGVAYLQYTPVKEGSIRVIGTDGSVKTATLDDPFTGKISGVAEGDVVYYLYDNETIPVTAPQIKLNIKSLPIETKSRKLTAIWSFDASVELSKELTYKVA